MTSFLEHVAADILSKYGTDLSRIAVVFPNKRAALFLNSHLARLAGKPLWSPSYITISDLFRNQSKRTVADPIKLVCDLYKSFVSQTGTDETLDHFYGWGQLLLSDFDDIDKQMADADRVFANIADLKEMDDDSFLTDKQREVLRRFFSNFTDGHETELKQRFLKLWSHLGSIYHDFNRRLEEQGLAYEGALYREVVEKMESSAEDIPQSSTDIQQSANIIQQSSTDVKCYLFVGFNALLRVEQRLFTLLRREGKARFYWDFDHYYKEENEAGFFIRQYLDAFPNEIDIHDDTIYRNFLLPKQITIASAATENIQARYASQWLKARLALKRERTASPTTAIVLCNEALLPTIIHCLPAEADSVNITTGYPLAQSPMTSLIAQLIALRREGYDNQRGHFRLRQVNTVLRNPYLMSASAQTATLAHQLTSEKIFFPTREQISVDELTTLLFRPFTPLYENEELLTWLCEVTKAIARTPATDVLREESIFRTYTLLNRLLNLVQKGDLKVDTVTLGRLINQLMQQTTVPFHGEPVEGLQVMGILETRNLDFDHLLILSASEGNLPRGAADTSFIPHALRRAYGLTTNDHKVAIYSYYFHRLLQRAKDITIVYNNNTANDGQKGEMSRFLLQLMVSPLPKPISFITLQGGQTIIAERPKAVENHVRMPKMITPKAINYFLRCPLQFHYYYECGLREPDDTDDDTIDNILFGNIFHEAARIIYSRMTEQSTLVKADDIDWLLKTKVNIERAVDDAFRSELFRQKQTEKKQTEKKQTEKKPRQLALNGLQIINREVIIHYLRQLLILDRQQAPFTILGLEKDVSMELQIQPQQGRQSKKVLIGGRIDRLDMITDKDGRKHIRVIDYKTGASQLKPLPDVNAVFSQESIKDHSDYYLQAMFYSIIVAHRQPDTPVSPALLFIQHTGKQDYDPVLHFGQEPIADVSLHADSFLQQLGGVVARMYDSSTLLSPTSDIKRCSMCPYRQLCYNTQNFNGVIE